MIPSNKGLKLPAEPLTPDEVKALINACSKRAIIQMQLGHSSLATTDRYVRHLNPAAVVEAMKARSWTL